MRREHRAAHRKAIAVMAVVIAVVLWQGWSMRSSRPVPEALAQSGAPAGTNVWSGSWETDAGPVSFVVASMGEDGPFRMTVTPAAGLSGLAESGVLLELATGSIVTLGSLGPARTSLALPPESVSGGQLVLIDLAREIRVAETSLPPREQWSGGAP